MKAIRNFFLSACSVILALAVFAAAPARAIETPAEYALMIDYDTGAVLLEKNADKQMYPASMTKMMTIYLLFERLANGAISLDDTLPVSEKAWRKGGSKMFVKAGDRVRIDDLIQGIIVQSGNDACIVVAEGLAGSEDAFATLMNEKARELGMTNSNFKNSTGWPDPEHVTTPRDLAILAVRLLKDFPQYFKYFSEKSFTYNGIKQGNRNPLLYKNMGADGFKTGHTQESGYGLVGTAKRGDRRIILVINGLQSVRQRASESERLIEWGFREFGNYKLFDAGAVVEQADVWLGDKATLPLVTEKEVKITIPRLARRKMTVKVVYEGPIPAPIAKGTPVARLVVSAPNTEEISFPLVAGADVNKLGLFGRIGAAINYLVWGAASATVDAVKN